MAPVCYGCVSVWRKIEFFMIYYAIRFSPIYGSHAINPEIVKGVSNV